MVNRPIIPADGTSILGNAVLMPQNHHASASRLVRIERLIAASGVDRLARILMGEPDDRRSSRQAQFLTVGETSLLSFR